jgi:pimeloyl-ACP methyl ester carboxylesterase
MRTLRTGGSAERAYPGRMRERARHPGLHDASGNALPHRLIDVDGVSTYVVDAGEGPPVLLVHGYGDTADGWRRVVPGLLRDHRVIALDVPPFGRSDEVRRPALMDFYKGFFPQLFAELGLDSATVIGHSLGGAISLHLTLERPDLVDRLGLVAPAGLGKKPPWWWYALTGYGPIYKTALSVPAPFRETVIRQSLKRFLDVRLFHDPRHLQDDIAHLVELHSSPRDFDRLLAAGRCCIQSYTGTLLEDSARIQVPKLMIWGRHDGLVPSDHARAFERLHDDAHVHVLEDCGHYPHIEFPSRFNDLLRRWIDATGPDAGRRVPLRAVA